MIFLNKKYLFFDRCRRVLEIRVDTGWDNEVLLIDLSEKVIKKSK